MTNDDWLLLKSPAQAPMPELGRDGCPKHPPNMFFIGCLLFAVLALAAGLVLSRLSRGAVHDPN